MPATRRYIWMSDEDWAEMRRRAAAQGVTVSAYVRQYLRPSVKPTLTSDGDLGFDAPKPSLAKALTHRS